MLGSAAGDYWFSIPWGVGPRVEIGHGSHPSARVFAIGKTARRIVKIIPSLWCTKQGPKEHNE